MLVYRRQRGATPISLQYWVVLHAGVNVSTGATLQPTQCRLNVGPVVFVVFLYRRQCFNYASDTYLLALPVWSTGQS